MSLNKQRFAAFMAEKISSPRERQKWSLGLGQGHNLKAVALTCLRSQSNREINNATTSEFSTLKLTNLNDNSFYG